MASGENMDIVKAEQQLKGMAHSEQHYFNRCTPPVYCLVQVQALSWELANLDAHSYNHHGMPDSTNVSLLVLNLNC